MNVADYTKRYFKRRKRNRVIQISHKRNIKFIAKKVVLKSGGAVKIVYKEVCHIALWQTIFTTNTALPIESILTAYSRRWSIEAVLLK